MRWPLQSRMEGTGSRGWRDPVTKWCVQVPALTVKAETDPDPRYEMGAGTAHLARSVSFFVGVPLCFSVGVAPSVLREICQGSNLVPRARRAGGSTLGATNPTSAHLGGRELGPHPAVLTPGSAQGSLVVGLGGPSGVPGIEARTLPAELALRDSGHLTGIFQWFGGARPAVLEGL